jgi:glycyl-tRNA synthetase
MFLAFLSEAYTEENFDGEERVLLKFSPKLAPVKVAVFPLLKNKPELVNKAREVYEMLREEMRTEWDDNGNVGKRYRRQDEIGTPFCVTIDFETLGESEAGNKDTVTVRDRDTGKQERVAISELRNYLKEKIK